MVGRYDLAEAGTPDELLEFCDGECDRCPFGERIPADRGVKGECDGCTIIPGSGSDK